MSKKIQLIIPKPCHENWDVMTQVEKGKFCGSCQKQVVDFTNMSDRQLAEFFKKPSTDSVCGRFMNDQLERELEVPKKRIPWLKYFFTIALPALFISKLSAQQKPKTIGKIALKPQSNTTIVTTVPAVRMLGEVQPVCIKPAIKDTSIIVKQIIIDKEKTIIGKVINEEGEVVLFTSVIIKGTTKGTTVKDDGTFTIKAKKGQVLLISGIGYQQKEIEIREENSIDIVLQHAFMPDIVMGIIAVAAPINKKIEPVKEKNKQKDKAPVVFNVYPNPASIGNGINLAFEKVVEGSYQVQLHNQSGKLIQQNKIWIDAEAKVVNIDLPTVSAGTYFLTLTNKETGKKHAEKIIVQ